MFGFPVMEFLQNTSKRLWMITYEGKNKMP